MLNNVNRIIVIWQQESHSFHLKFPTSQAWVPAELVSSSVLISNPGKYKVQLICTCEIELIELWGFFLGWFWCLPNLYLSWYTSCQSLVMSYWPGKFLTSVGQTDFRFCFSLVTTGMLSNKACKNSEALGERQWHWTSAAVPLVLHVCPQK